MAKSVGNIARVADLLEAGVSPRALRYALISVHYRAALAYSEESLAAAAQRRSSASMRCSPRCTCTARIVPDDPSLPAMLDAARAAFDEALDNDLNVSARPRRAVRRSSAS